MRGAAATAIGALASGSLLGAACAGYTTGQQRATERWQSLRELASDAGVEMGCALTGWTFNHSVYGEKARRTFAENFNLATIEHGFYWSHLHHEPERLDFQTADYYYDWARANGLRTRGHALLFPGWATPPWVDAIYDTNQLRAAVQDHITAVLAHYPALDEVVVVNEPSLRGHGTRQFDLFHTLLRDDYIPLAFETAYAAHPSATLIYNDTLNHGLMGTVNGLTTQLTHDNLLLLEAAGLLDPARFRLGVQLHLRAHDLPDWDDMTRTIAGYRERFGIEVIVTEYDCDMSAYPPGIGGYEDRADMHGLITEQALRAYLRAEAGRSFTVWGIGDGYSWLELGENRPAADATLYTDAIQPKPAVERVRAVLREDST